MKQTFKCVVRYDGTGFAGWQVQPGQDTVQGAIEDALSTMANARVRIDGAGRTDAGVHALGQVFSFSWDRQDNAERLAGALSKMLGPRLQVVRAEEVAEDFHARYCARAKRYAYTIACGKTPDPFLAPYAWTISHAIDWALLDELTKRLTGRHDFAGFQCSGSDVQDTRREIYRLDCAPGTLIGPCDALDVYRLDFHGNGFLYKMVRNITGTLVDIARGNLAAEVLDERLASPGPYQGFTAPPQGLALVQVIY